MTALRHIGIFLGLICCTLARPQGPTPGPPPPEGTPRIIKKEYDLTDNGYVSDFETENGIKQREEGTLKDVPSDPATPENGKVITVVGTASWTDKEGNTFTLQYTADENGFVPVGNHLPTPPPIPPAIQKALEYIAAHPEENDAGQGKPPGRPAGRK